MAHSLEYKDQSAQDLKVHVVRGDLDIGQFQVMEERAFKKEPDFSVVARIIGSSHVISFNVNGEILHEVVACQDVSCNGSEVHKKRFANSEEWICFFPQLGYYHFQSKISRQSVVSDCMLHFLRERQDAFRYDFPAVENGVTAETIISVSLWRKGSNSTSTGCTVESAHSYPNEGQVAFTRTSFFATRSS